MFDKWAWSWKSHNSYTSFKTWCEARCTQQNKENTQEIKEMYHKGEWNFILSSSGLCVVINMMWVVVQHKGVTSCFAWHPVGLDVYLTKATLSRQTDLQSRWTGIGQNNSNSLKVLKNTSDVNNGFCCMWIPVFLVKGIYLKQVCQTVLNKCKWNYVEWIFLTAGQEKNLCKEDHYSYTCMHN